LPRISLLDSRPHTPRLAGFFVAPISSHYFR